MPLSGAQLSILFLIICCIFTGTFACFIRNCPPGGKRSVEVDTPNERQCMSCGPGNTGQCVGPDICCGDFGCMMGTREAAVCEKENENTVPCVTRGEVCGSRGQGRCVADQICCDAGACSFNHKCKRRDSEKLRTTREELLQLVQKLLHSKNYN
ncbi:conopressin/neurophysin-like [Gigantopelta aegis]|uniref:conopressin/neurophysin-like n=1 Tax=Gigantopelta aegis TaxID=1735272 RepID=UPI001B88BC7B|nr:conopressin/neurophysin-like [Gigantopelta aegis]